MNSKSLISFSRLACVCLTVLSAAAFAAATFAELPNSSDDKNKKESEVVKSEKPDPNAMTHKQFPVDVSDMFELELRSKLIKDKKNKGEYFVFANLKNVSGETVPGPLRLVIEDTGIKTLVAIKGTGRLHSGADYVEFLDRDGRINDFKKSKKEKLIFTSIEPISKEDLKAFDLTWRLTREKASKFPAKTAPDSFDKLMATKKYSVSDLKRTLEIQEQFSNQLFSENKKDLGKQIFSLGTTENKNGDLALQLSVNSIDYGKTVAPNSFGGVPVILKSSSAYYAIPPGAEKNNQILKPRIDDSFAGPGGNPRQRFDRPVPIGVSISNVTDACISGTLGCRCSKADGSKVVLTNNHVIGKENLAQPGQIVIQPSRGDDPNTCTTSTANEMGQVDVVVPIEFTTTANNVIDATTATTTVALTNSCTADDGYGFPLTTPVVAAIGMPVQKSGRTTNFQKGSVAQINVVSFVGFSTGVARFERQIQITPGSFSAGGDSGSLIVSDPGKEPVGLLFAGNDSSTLANPIQDVLTRLGLTIDGEGIAPPPPPTDKASIGNFVWEDVNENGIQDDDELGVQGVTVELFDAGGNGAVGGGDDASLGTRVTTAGGNYTFSDLDPGDYFLTFTPEVSTQQFTTQDTGDDDNIDSDVDPATGNTGIITIEDVEAITNVDAGLLPLPSGTGNVGNRVWLDINGDGHQGRYKGFTRFRREPGVPGITVSLIRVSNGRVIGTTETNRRGFYRFKDIPSGKYCIQFSPLLNHAFSPQNAAKRGGIYRDSDPDSTGKTATFEVLPSQTNYSIDAGLVPLN